MVKEIDIMEFDPRIAVKDILKGYDLNNEHMLNVSDIATIINEILAQWAYSVGAYKSIIKQQQEIISKQRKEIDQLHDIIKEETGTVLVRKGIIE